MKGSLSIQEYQVSNAISTEETMEVKKHLVHLYMFLQGQDIPLLILAIIITLISSLTSTGLSILTGRVFDVLAQVAKHKNDTFAEFDHKSKIACFSIAALSGGVFLFSWATISLWMKLGEKQQLRVRVSLYSSLFNKSVEWFESNSELNGDMVQVNRCIEEFRSGVSECTAITLQCVCSSVALTVTSLVYSWNLTLVILSSVPIIIATAWVFNIQIKKYADLENCYSSSSAKILDFNLTNPAFVKIFNGQALEMTKFKKETIKSRNNFNKMCFYSSLNVGILRVLVLMMFVQGFWYGFYLVKTGSLTSGQVITTFLSCLILADTSYGVAEQLIILQKAQVALNKIMKFIGTNKLTTHGDELEKKLYPQICYGDITFEDVHFSYPSRSDQVLLDGFNLYIPAGKTSYIVGKSGSGKSTLSALLLNFYKQASGIIRIDGYDINDLSPLWLTDKITLVEQNVTLFGGTVKTNIALGTAYKQDIENVNETLLKEAVQFSLLQNLIIDLPDGIETLIGTKGKALSGGQQQRVAIARAKMRDTPILILDEATSGLDTIHKELIISAVKGWRKGKTTIIMTHEFSQIENDDNVLLMQDGKVTETGSKKVLIEKKGAFYKLNNFNSFDDHIVVSDIGEHEDDDFDDDYFEFEILNDVQKSRDFRFSIFTGRDWAKSEIEPYFSTTKRTKRVKRREIPTTHTTEIEETEGLRPEKLISLYQTFKFMKSHIQARFSIAFGVIFAIINGVTKPLFSYCFSKLLSSIVSVEGHDSSGYVMKWALIVVAVIFADGLSMFIKKFLLSYASESWIVQIRHTAFDQILEHDLNWNESSLNNANEISALLMNDSRDLRSLVSEFLDVLFTVSVMMAMGLTWSFVVGWKLSLVAISVLPIFVIVTAVYSGVLQVQENKYKTTVAELESLQHQVISGIRTIKCLRLNSYFNKNFKNLKTSLETSGSKRSIGTGFGVACSALLMLISQSIILYYGLRLVATGSYTYSQLIETLTLLIFTLSSASDCVSKVPDISRLQRLSTYLIRLLSMENDYEGKGSLTPYVNVAPNDIEFNNVNFKYPSRPIKALQNLTFDIKRKEIYGIVGESGSGKSTIVSLILKLQSCDGIYLWGTAINEIDTNYLRSCISVVSQKAIFFKGSIKENLIYGLNQVKTDEQIMVVLKMALLYEFVVSLPQGIETPIGNDHNSLISGGQAQRLSIARALLRDPSILILDECTSALDPVTSSQIRDLVDQNLRSMDITILIITHHEEMMRITDKLILLENGQVKEKGTFKDLYHRRDSALFKLLDFGGDS